MFNLVSKSLYQRKQALALTTLTLGGQTVLLAATPLLTNIYGPSAFGQFSIFTLIANSFAIVSNLRYDLAIANPRKISSSLFLYSSALVASLATLTFSAIILFIISHSSINNIFAEIYPNPQLLSLQLFAVFIVGVNLSSSAWLVRQRKLVLLGTLKFLTPLLTVIISLILSDQPAGLIYGFICGVCLLPAIMYEGIYQFVKSLVFSRRYRLLVLAYLIKYKKYPLFSAPAGLINALAAFAPLILLSLFKTDFYVGLYAFASFVMISTPNFITSSASNYYLSNAPAFLSSGCLLYATDKFVKKTLVIAFPIITIISISGYCFIQIFMDASWTLASSLVLALLPESIAMVCISPVFSALTVAGKTKEQFQFQLLFLISRYVSFIVPTLAGLSIVYVVMISSISSAISYSFYYRSIRKVIA